MLISSAVCGPLQANCYLLAPAENGPCVIIDPGMEAVAPVTSLLSRHRLTPVGILATHGHIDHIADAAYLADQFGVALWIAQADRHLLSDPASGLNADLAGWISLVLPQGVREPGQVEILGEKINLAGIDLAVTPAPGHTAGSVLYTVTTLDEVVVFCGDVVFAGSIGRTDLPGSSPAQMVASLRGPVMDLPDSARLLPGHGEETTMAHERQFNPYLQPSFLNRV